MERTVDDLRGLGDRTSRPVFGGHGIDWREVIVGMVFRERLDFKADEESEGEYPAGS